MKFKERLTQPQAIRQIIVFIFGLGVIYGTLSHRITALEKFKEETNLIEIKTTLWKVQTDLERIKNAIIKNYWH